MTLKKRFILLIFFLFVAYQSLLANNRRVLFSPENNSWVESLKQEVNKHLLSESLSDTLFLDFREGVYSLQESLKFMRNNPDKINAPIILRGNGRVIFSGGKILNNKLFKAISDESQKQKIISKLAQEKVLEYSFKNWATSDLGEIKCIGFGRTEEIPPPQLFIDGKKMILARYPNAGDANLLKYRTTIIPITKIVNQGRKNVYLPIDAEISESNHEQGEFQYSDLRVEKWLGAKDIWLDGIFSRDWSWSLNRVNRIDTVNKTISLVFDEKYNLSNTHSFFFASNLLEEIDAPGEYFIDRDNAKLFFYPPTNFNLKTADIQLSYTTNKILEFEGISNFTIENICFELGRSSAVSLNQCSNIIFRHCEFLNFGLSALSIKGENNRVEECLIHSIGGTAISLDGGSFETLAKANNIVIGCEIYDWACYNRVYTPAIELKGVGNQIVDNTIYNAPHGAITISGNDHLIEKNEISNVLLEFMDFGAIYAFQGLNQLRRGHIIRNNYFHDIGLIGDRVYAIYADEASAGWLIENNLFYRIGNENSRIAAIFGNTCSYVKVINNIFLDCNSTFDLSFHFYTWGKMRYEDYFYKSWKEKYGKEGAIPQIYLSRYPELRNFMKEERILVTTNSFIGNKIENFMIPLSHQNYFTTRNGTPESDSLVFSRDNIFIDDKTLPLFLDQWNVNENRAGLGKSIPETLYKYLQFRK